MFFSDCKPSRTRAQNRYLWGVVYKTISDHTGYETNELHEVFKQKFSLRTTFDFGGDVVEYQRSTANFDTKEMTEYIEKIRVWGGEHGIHIPQAGELPDAVLILTMN